MGRYRAFVLFIALALFAACAKSAKENHNAPATSPSSGNTNSNPAQVDNRLLQEIQTGTLDSVRQLLDSGANVNGATESGVTPLMNASGMGNKEVVQLLIARGANVNARTPGNFTALMQAALVGQTEIIKVLLDAGADPGVKDTGGKTAQTYAEERGNKEIVALLKNKK